MVVAQREKKKAKPVDIEREIEKKIGDGPQKALALHAKIGPGPCDYDKRSCFDFPLNDPSLDPETRELMNIGTVSFRSKVPRGMGKVVKDLKPIKEEDQIKGDRRGLKVEHTKRKKTQETGPAFNIHGPRKLNASNKN